MHSITQHDFKLLIKGGRPTSVLTSVSYIKDSSGDTTIIFDDCLIEDTTLDEAVDYPYNIRIQNSEFAGNFQINGGLFKRFDIDNTVLNEKHLFIVRDGKFDYLTTYDITFNGQFSTDGGEFNFLHIRGKFRNHLSLNGTFREIRLQDCFASAVFFEKGNFSTVFIASLGTHRLFFQSGNFGYVSVYTTEQIDFLHLDGGTFTTFHLNTAYLQEIKTQNIKGVQLIIENLLIGQMGRFDGVFFNAKVGNLEFTSSYLDPSSRLRFQDLTAKSVTFYGFVNYGQLAFFALTLEGALKIKNSDLGKTSFINSSIKNVSLNVENSRITEAFFSDNMFPNRVADSDIQQRNVYAQLKKMNEAKGDYLESNRFYAQEMDAYYKTFPWGSPLEKAFWEKFNLLLNKHSNDHGQNWALAFIWTLFVGGLFYAAYLLSLGGWELNISSWEHWRGFFRNCSYFLEFINPIHKTDIVAENLGIKSNSIARFFETSSRIALAYTTYQMIQAFRKHAKK